ncbi:CoA-acylating methylmalonate-semialdehyde dehydrogenase [Anaerosacchariphilus polymeriproducens]|uniref:methylmalonate-semialdehyde dehydrogenase (CoA acylating) n=1 Tax=Anaerosacchariphilus polymeriproducens TaxID=1812858 RepID=A0A371AUI2_9FIRM|nr:CoA-acylating methylmalonate-semialdehyde dehydrogenase [Anaerosacchariphilus polymeriproducens]RDU23150.1 methylmalonate-semialdehyde dehydrogenase (CoA acylating) [Anaerosacchariphilus polymeriproducens]
MSEIKKLKYFVDGQWLESMTEKYMPVYNPSTGEVQAEAPCCTQEEVDAAIDSAAKAFPSWSQTPVTKRVQILFKFRDLLDKHFDELTEICAREHGKNWNESAGDIAKVKEPIEVACGMPNLMMGESLMNTSTGYDTVMYREPLGVFAGIAPFNFPGMIPMGWMVPFCVATGNTIVIKASSVTPMTAIRCAELWQEAGLPDGVLNIVTCSRNEAEIFLKHPKIKGVSFVGTTKVGLHIYSTAAAHGKRVQAQTEAKNHALVLEDCALERTVRGIINSSFGCAGERCMALPVVVVQENIADEFVALLKKLSSELKIGPAYDKATQLGPVVSAAHRENVTKWIEKGIEEGAELVLDGRKVTVEGYENGFYMGPTIFDHVKPGMTVGDEEIFGPVVCIKRVKDFEEGITIMNDNPFANGSIIYTQNGYFSREFARRTHGGMVGINVGIPVPVGVFPFCGHKDSFFGDLHCLGKDGVRFFTEVKAVTTTWFDEKEKKNKNIDSWDGTI